MIAIAPTDSDWFEQLRDDSTLKVVNFWTPTPWNVRQLDPGDRFYFMRKAPIRMIGGYGHFLQYENMTAEEAWSALGVGNGVESLDELIDRASDYAKNRSEAFEPTRDPTIGCIVLRDPVFFEDEDHIDLDGREISFPAQVVKHKYFPEIDALDQSDAETSTYPTDAPDNFSLVSEESRTYTTQRKKEREGQQQFRKDVLDAYGGRCCMTGERVPNVLEAAHIQPYVNERSNHVQNGLPLRVDLHRLFDAGLLTITTGGEVRVSTKLSSDTYEQLDGRTIAEPDDPADAPAEVAIRYHNRFKFREGGQQEFDFNSPK